MRYSQQGWFREQFGFLRRQFLQEGDLPFTNVLSEEAIVPALEAINRDLEGQSPHAFGDSLCGVLQVSWTAQPLFSTWALDHCGPNVFAAQQHCHSDGSWPTNQAIPIAESIRHSSCNFFPS